MGGVFVGGSRLVSAPPNLRLWSSVLSAAAQIVPCILEASLSPFAVTIQIPRCHSHSLLTLTWFALVVIASSTKLAPGVVAKVCLSLSPRLSSLRTSLPVRLLVLSSSAITPQHFSNSTSHSVTGAVIFLGGPVLLLSQQFTGSWVSAMHSALPSDVHSRCLVACVPWTTLPPPPDPASVFRLCSSVQGTWSHWCASALRGSPPSAVRHWLSRSHSPSGPRLAPQACSHGFRPAWRACRLSLLTTSSLPGRTRSTHSTSLPPRCVCGSLLVWVTTSPPQAAPPATCLLLPLAPSAMISPLLLRRPHQCSCSLGSPLRRLTT